MMIKDYVSIQGAIKKATDFFIEKNIEYPRITSEILVSHILSITKTKLYLKLNDFISKDEFEKFWSFVVARSNNIPIQYLTQEVNFLDLKLFINKGVFIPRPETEILTQKAVLTLKNMSIKESINTNNNVKANRNIKEYKNKKNCKKTKIGKNIKANKLIKTNKNFINNNHLIASNEKKLLVLDIGTGCGAIGLAIANEVSTCLVYATDISEKALDVARSNAVNLNLSDRIIFLKGNLFEPLSLSLKFSLDLIISNPPYVPISKFKELQPEIREHEPENALIGGEDGLFYYREIISKSLNFLKKNGYLLLEIGYNQSKQIKEIIKKIKEYNIREIIKDLSKVNRVVVLQKEK